MTSQVDYSTDPALPASATLTQTDGAFVLQHSLTLTGLAPAATYYFRVISMDADDNIQVATPR